MRVLVFAPHPDDEVMGIGGTIARHVQQGDEVHLCVVTKAYPPEWSEKIINVKRKEAIAAARILGIKETYFLDFPTVKLDTIPQKEVNEALSKCVRDVQPEIIYTSHRGDVNKDHRLVYEATLVATRPLPGSPVKKVLSYELLSSTEWGSSSPENAFIPNVYVNISDTLEIKKKALSVYKTEIKKFPHPRSFDAMFALAKLRGSTIGVAAAEAFMLVREIVP